MSRRGPSSRALELKRGGDWNRDGGGDYDCVDDDGGDGVSVKW